jgi:hypothetical protein
MQKLNVSVLVAASAAFAATFGPAAVAQDGPRRAPFERLCAERGGPSHHPEMADRISEYLDLNDTQKAAFKEFHEARRKSLEDSKATLCASKPDLSSFEACGWRIGNFGINRRCGAVLRRLAGMIISTYARSAPPGDPSARDPCEIPRPGRHAPGRS